MYKKKEDLTVPPANMAWPFFLRCGPHDRAMTQVSSPPLGAMEIPRQSEELNQGAGLATSFAHDRAWTGVVCVPVEACLSKTKQFTRLV
jgi:hypothetical protein